MAPIYAGILGLLALLTSLAHGMIHARDPESTLRAAWCCLVGFSALGYLVGRIAARTVDESVGVAIRAELDSAQSTDRPTPA